jgi:16S rRNA (guanine966-N2)-methyltransferase
MAQRRSSRKPPTPEEEGPTGLRIIGGNWRGRTIEYSGDLRTRPMKNRVREAVYNLVGIEAKGSHAIDLFAGTGALGLEALSRGAVRATFIERHIPTAKLIRANIEALGPEPETTEVLPQSAFIWARRHEPLDPTTPWLVLCSPPFDFYIERREEMLAMIERLWEEAPSGSVFVLEADERYDFTGLPAESEWDVRTYAPAVIGVARKRANR